MLLGLFYLIIDVFRIRKWAFFFIAHRHEFYNNLRAAAQNSRFDIIRDFFLKGIHDLSPEMIKPFIGSIGYIAVVWLFLWFLYRNRIFLKV
ncbi:MAG: hypothetical protein U5L72_08615 [Bacteroidales bacterium]|nr:hypothetical protein [Bacteroidales bacterium]